MLLGKDGHSESGTFREQEISSQQTKQTTEFTKSNAKTEKTTFSDSTFPFMVGHTTPIFNICIKAEPLLSLG